MLSVSVIIATKDREDQLRSVSLPSLARQEGASSFEVIVWDASDNDKSRTLAEEFAAENPCVAVRYFKAPRVGLSRQRNDAVKEASGDVVFFIDDDSEISPDGIRALAEMFAADDRIAGGCLPLDYNFPAGTKPAILRVTGPLAWLVRGYYWVFEPSKKASGFYPPHPPVLSGSISYLFGCDMAFRKEIFATHRFDERLQRFSNYVIGDDQIFSRVLMQEGHEFGVASKGCVIHRAATGGRFEPGFATGRVEGYNAGLMWLLTAFPRSRWTVFPFLWARTGSFLCCSPGLCAAALAEEPMGPCGRLPFRPLDLFLGRISWTGEATVTKYSRKAIWGARIVELLLSPLARLRRRPEMSRLPANAVIVLLEPFQLGDVMSLAVMIGPILTKFPEARIVLWCHTKTAEIFRGDKRIWKTVTAPFPWSSRGSKRGNVADWSAVLASCREVSRLRPNVGIDPRGDIRSQVIMLLARCAARIGFQRYMASNMVLRGLLLTHPLSELPETHRYLSNLETLAPVLGSVPALHLPAYGPQRACSARPAGEKIVLLHPGAGWPFKLWPAERWIALVRRLQASSAVRVVQVVGPGERDLAAQISAGVPHGLETHVPAFGELLARLAAVDLVICLDSGPMNAAVLMNVPVIALFGPGNAAQWRPLSDGSAYFQHVEAYPCHPCSQIVCVHPENPCMRTISVDEVFARAAAILGISFPETELVQLEGTPLLNRS